MAFAASFSLVAFSCGNDEPELGPGDVRTLRVLGVRSVPADPLPGEKAVLSALVLNPLPDEVAMVWAALDPSAALPSEGAARGGIDPASLGFAGLVTPPIFLPRLVGPSFPLTVTGTYVPPDNLPADVTSVAVVVLARAGEVNIGRALDPDTREGYLRELLEDAVPAIKIMRIGDPVTNVNPRITMVLPKRKVIEYDESTKSVKKGVRIDTWTATRGGMIEMEAVVEDESPLCESGDTKEYGKRGQSCVSFSWYSANGLLRGFVRSTATWRAPRLAGIYTVAIVARDRIGGLTWHLQDISVGRPVAPGAAGRVLLRSDTAESEGTQATRLVWLPVDDPALHAELAAKGKNPFVATIDVMRDANDRLHFSFAPSSFVFSTATTKATSLQVIAEQGRDGTLPVTFAVEILE